MRRRDFTRLLLVGGAVGALPLRSWAQSATQRRSAAEVMEWLGVTAVVEQAPTALDYALAAERRARDVASSVESSWRRALANDFSVRTLREALLDNVMAHYDAQLFRHGGALLQQPIARRVRYFEQAMTQRGAPGNLREFLERLPVTAPAPERRQQIEAIEARLRYAEQVATLQSYAARAVQLTAGPSPVAVMGPIEEEIALRQRYLQPLLIDYLLYAWRYLKVEELAAYEALLAEPPVQRLLEIGHEALVTTLAGTLPTPPADEPAPGVSRDRPPAA